MSVQYSRQGMAALPAPFPRPRSSLIRRLVEAKDDPAKQRVRAWLAGLDDVALSRLGLSPSDISLLRDAGQVRIRD